MKALLISTRDPRGRLSGRKMVLRTIIGALRRLGIDVICAYFEAEKGLVNREPLDGARFVRLAPPSTFRVAANMLASVFSTSASLNEALYWSPETLDELGRLVRGEAVDFVICDMLRTAGYGERLGRPWICDLDDLLSSRLDRERASGAVAEGALGFYDNALLAGLLRTLQPFWTAILARESRRLAARERQVVERATVTTLVSKREAARLESEAGRPVFAAPMALPLPQHLADAGADKLRYLFVGPLNYRANYESVAYLKRFFELEGAALPPDLGVDIVGFAPEELQAQLAHPRLRFLGYADDLDKLAAGYPVFLAPILGGTGIKTKVVEAMLRGQLVLSLPAGAMGMEIADGEHFLGWQEPGELASILAMLPENAERRRRIAEAGRDYALANFTAEVSDRRWRGLVDRVLGRAGAPAAEAGAEGPYSEAARVGSS